MSRLRIASIIWRDAIGGAERSLTDLAAALDRRKFDMIFYYLSGEPGYFANQIKQLGFNVEFLKWDNGRDISGRINLIKRLKQYSPHVIHDHILPPLTRPFIKMFIRRPILNTEHGSAVQRSLGIGKKWRNKFEKFDFLFCDYIAANSAVSAEALKGAYRIPDKKIGIVHLGIDLGQFNPAFSEQQKEDCLIIGYVGRIVNEHKGVDYLPLVAKALNDQFDIRFKIIVAGDGPDREKVEHFCKELEVQEQFTFLGWVRDVNNFLKKIDILLVPSRFEPLGLTAIEALAMNIPVVAFDVGGLREILSECPGGRLVKPGDVNGMAAAIYSICQNHKNVGNKARKFVEERFSNIKMARQYESVYMSLI